MIVITSGKKYLDIDGYASSIAYRELLKLLGIDTKFVSTATYNYSITNSLSGLPYSVDDYKIKDNDKFIIIDLSNKKFFESFVNEDNIIEIIDHHPGYEEYWKNKIGNKAIIERIGSVATIIVEKYEENNLLNKMNKDIARLLMAAILDNTLNFTANITNDRDKVVYKKLEKITGDIEFRTTYFSECQKVIESDLINSIKNDLKIEKTNEYLPNVIGQLTIWDITTILNKKEIIEDVMNNYGSEWLINIISLSENKSYILCSNKNVLSNITKLFNGKTDNNMLIITPAKLRKEIMTSALNLI